MEGGSLWSEERQGGIFSTGEIGERDPRKQGACLEKKVQLEPWRRERLLKFLAWRDREIKHTVLSCCKLPVMSVMEVEILALWSQGCPVTSSAFPIPEVEFFFWLSQCIINPYIQGIGGSYLGLHFIHVL